MRAQFSKCSRAFTLVELTIVVAILGILAAIVIPKLSSATDVARSNGAMSQLTSVRKQLEVWKLNHGDTYPTIAQIQTGTGDWETFTSKTSETGDIDPDGLLGPYFPTPPINPFTNSSLVVEAGSAVISAGWTYNETTGVLKLVLPGSVNPAATDLGANDYEQIAED